MSSIGWPIIGKAVLCCVVVAALAAPASAAPTLPPPVVPDNALLFGDMFVYSMAFLHSKLTGTDTKPSGNDEFAVESTPGAIKDCIVLLTGTSSNPAVNNGDNADEAEAAPSGDMNPSFSNLGDPDPDEGPTLAPDSIDTWDADTAAIRAVIGTGQQVVFWFNLNETGGPEGLDDQDLLSWALFTLEDSTGVLPDMDYYLTGDGLTDGGAAGKADSIANGAPDDTDPDNDPRWAYVHGRITVDADGNLLHFGPKLPGDPADARELDQNLGSDNAAFALFNQELSDKILDEMSGYDTIRVSMRLNHINNGFEQLFVKGANFGTFIIPEPASIVAWSMLGAMGLAYGIRRRRAA